MYIENNYEKEPGYTSILNENENKTFILEDLKFNISTQFKFENLGYNYLKDYDDPPLEIFDWLLDYINEYYFVIGDLISIYEQVDRIKFIGTTLYEFLFVDIIEILPKLNIFNPFKNEILNYFAETIISLSEIRQELLNNGLNSNNINKEVLKYTTLLSLLDTNFEKFNDNYIINIKNRIIV